MGRVEASERAGVSARRAANDPGAEPDTVLSGRRDLGLKTRFVGRRVHYLSSVDSTNAACWALAARGDSEGTVVLAEEQTDGRGRTGRAWFSPPHLGLWGSVLVRPRLAGERLAALSIATAVSVASALKRWPGVDAGVKWPNDIVAGGKKIGGVLVESGQMSGDVVDTAVVGIGINVNITHDDFPGDLKSSATSLAMLAGRPIDRIDVLRAVLAEFESCYTRYLTSGISGFTHSWRELSTTLGTEIAVERDGAMIVGRVVDLASSGALILGHDNGQRSEIWYGDVRLRR